jgi:hypothetical protein
MLQNWKTDYLYQNNVVNINDFVIYTSGDKAAITMSPSESDFYMVINYGRDMWESKLTGSTAFLFSLCDKMATLSDNRAAMSGCDCSFTEPSLI